MVAVEVRPGRVAARSRLRAVGVHHREDPEVHVLRQARRVARDVADQEQQRVLAGDLVAVLLRVEEDLPRGRRAGRRGRQVDEVDRAALRGPALHGHADRALSVDGCGGTSPSARTRSSFRDSRWSSGRTAGLPGGQGGEKERREETHHLEGPPVHQDRRNEEAGTRGRRARASAAGTSAPTSPTGSSPSRGRPS